MLIPPATLETLAGVGDVRIGCVAKAAMTPRITKARGWSVTLAKPGAEFHKQNYLREQKTRKKPCTNPHHLAY
jgi:hypothetical protein